MNPPGETPKLTTVTDIVTPPDLRLHDALEKGNLKEVLKKCSIIVNETDKYGCTVLHNACRRYDKDAIKLLFEQDNIDVNVRENNGETPLLAFLERTLSHSDDEVADIIVLFWRDERVDLNAEIQGNYRTILHTFLRERYRRKRSIELTKKLLTIERKTMKLDVNIKDASGNPVWFDLLSDESVLNLIIAHESFNVNTVDSEGKTLLMRLINNRFMANTINQLLKKQDIDLDLRDNFGKTVTHHLLQVTGNLVNSEHVNKLVRYLLTEGKIDINAVDSRGTTFLMQAVHIKCKKLLELILEHGPDINYQDVDGNTALMQSKDEDISLLLIDAGADINVANNIGLTMLREAMMARKKSWAETIVQKEIYNVNRVINNLTDLMWLFMYPCPMTVGEFAQTSKYTGGNLKMDCLYLNWATSMLLQHPDCDITVINKDNQSVFHLMHTRLPMLQCLVAHKSYKAVVLSNPDKFGKTFFHNLFGSNAQAQLQQSVDQKDKVIDSIVAKFRNSPAVHNLQDRVGNPPLW